MLPLLAAGLAVALLLGVLLAGCGGNDEGAGDPSGAPPPETTSAGSKDPPPEERGGEGRAPAVVRLSGSAGTVFAGSYGNLEGSENAEGVLEGEPIEYEVEVRDSGFDIVSASFVKPSPSEGTLAVEILVDGEVVTRSDTNSQYGALNISWSFGG